VRRRCHSDPFGISSLLFGIQFVAATTWYRCTSRSQSARGGRSRVRKDSRHSILALHSRTYLLGHCHRTIIQIICFHHAILLCHGLLHHSLVNCKSVRNLFKYQKITHKTYSYNKCFLQNSNSNRASPQAKMSRHGNLSFWI